MHADETLRPAGLRSERGDGNWRLCCWRAEHQDAARVGVLSARALSNLILGTASTAKSASDSEEIAVCALIRPRRRFVGFGGSSPSSLRDRDCPYGLPSRGQEDAARYAQESRDNPSARNVSDSIAHRPRAQHRNGFYFISALIKPPATHGRSALPARSRAEASQSFRRSGLDHLTNYFPRAREVCRSAAVQ